MPMPGTEAPGIRTMRRTGSAPSGSGGSTASRVIPSGNFNSRVNPGWLEVSVRRFSAGEIANSMGSSRRSARSTAPLRKLATDCVAEAKRTLSMPAEAAGTEMPASRPMMVTTTSISMSVTPRWQAKAPAPLCLLVFPTDNVGGQPFPAGLPVLAVADNVRLIAVLARELVDIVVLPGIFRDILRHVRPGPLGNFLRLDAQRLQPLLGGGERARIELVGPQRRHEVDDLSMRGRDFGLVGVFPDRKSTRLNSSHLGISYAVFC